MEESQKQMPEGWEIINISDVTISCNDKKKQIKSSEYLELGAFPVVDQSENFICGYTEEKDKVISENLPVTVFGDHTRHTKYIDFPFVCGADGTQVLKPKGKVCDKFYFYLVYNASILIGNHGYDRHFKHLKEFKTVIPKSKTEQTTIARILSKVDEAIAQTEQLIAKYTRIKTGLMQDLLTKGIDEHGNIRSEETHEFKDSPLGRIPREWDFKRLDDCKTKNTSITYGIVQTFEHIEGGVPVLRTIDLKENGINPINQLLRTKQSISAKYKRTLLLENDIVCNVRASVGDFNIVSSEYINCNTTRGVARICSSNEINPSYLVWFLKSYKNEKQMELLIKGTTFIDINIGDLRKIWVLLPKKAEQDAIADKLDKIQNSFKIYDTQLIKLHSLRTGLMQDLLSGKVRVNHLIKETATV